MEKFFNVTGCCNSRRHYMVDITNKYNQVMKMVERGEYFIINRPRQFGKTTMLNTLAQELWKQKDKYVVARFSFEGLGDAVFANENDFCSSFTSILTRSLTRVYPDLAEFVAEKSEKVTDLKFLSDFITDFSTKCHLPVVVLIDEVDKSSNNQLFLSFLGMLRDLYLDRDLGVCNTFQSVVLAGVHDVKSLKLKLRDDSDAKLNSPWNIAADFNVDMSFNPTEIKTMLISYVDEAKVEMDIDAIAERLHYYTNGYPFLVSKLCKNIAEEAVGNLDSFNPGKWTVEDVDWAFRWLTREDYTTTNFDDLVKNLENNPELYDLVYTVLFGADEELPPYSPKDPVINLGILYGIFRNNKGKAAIHNRVYEQILADYMRTRKLTRDGGYSITGVLDKFEESGKLDLKKVLLKFQAFMKEHYSDKDSTFLEREGRLVFMSFLKPIINGSGFMWKEPVVAEERRMDIVVTYGSTQKEIVELKIWRGDEYHQAGLQQLSDYMDFQGLKNGFLLIFDFNKNKSYKSEQIIFKDKSLFAVWV